ncbi:hypothetical protein [Litchfieldella xinjiangensis]|uniref:hypothetical protein n=1 Tax=Litchfieldella xinjiangensis TaxID=1166948 RepID=UPI0005BA2E4C|nr:hypothetical protein [Halomonas xinjiangensis]
MKNRKLLPAALIGAALCANTQLALAAPDLRLSGFGTLGYVTTDTNDAQFRASRRQHKGATDSGDWGVDSRLGLQANLTFNEWFSAVGQGYTSRRDGDSSPDLEWLFLQANVTDWATLRAGRMVVPTFLISDSRNVGYAQHWLRAPVEVYDASLTSSFDGLQGVLQNELGDYNITTRLSAGKASDSTINVNFIGNNVLEFQEQSDRLYSIDVKAQKGDWTGRVGYTYKSENRLDLMGAKYLEGDDNFYSTGLQYDNGSLLAMSEYVMRRFSGEGAVDGKFDSDSYYLTAGYRFGSLMPYATYAHFKPKGDGYGLSANTDTTAVGVRWDAARNIAFKAQVDRVSGDRFAQQLLPDADFQHGDLPVYAYSVAVDFVF